MNTLFVGIDVSTKSNQVCAMNFDQEVIFNNSSRNIPEESELLFRLLVSTLQNSCYDEIQVVAESTSVYDYHICSFLTGQLRDINIESAVYSVNAKVIANYRKSYLETEKTDKNDAFMCADFARVGRTRNLKKFRANHFSYFLFNQCHKVY